MATADGDRGRGGGPAGLKERVYSVLVVSASERFSAALNEFLPENSYSPVTAVSSVSAAKRAVAQRPFDLVFINSPLPDDAGLRFAVDCCQDRGAVAVIFAAADRYDQVCARVAERGVYVLPKPTPRGSMLRAVGWMVTTRERLRGLEKKVQPIEEKMEEIRLVDRAKWLLIGELKMSEPDAHRYISRQAMDRCVSKREVAEEIIRLYA